MSLHTYQTTTKPPEECDPPCKVVTAIVNPASGARKGPKALATLKSILEPAGVEVKVFETQYAGHCGEICKSEDFSGVHAICPIGGDGTLHECVNGLMNREDDLVSKILVAIVPAGSGNTVAFDLGINSVEHAADLILKQKYKKIDLAECRGLDDKLEPLPQPPIYSCNMIGWALPSKVLRTANNMRKCGCGAMYDLAIYKFLLTNDYFVAKITYVTEDDQTHVKEGKIASFVVQDTVHLGSKTPLAPTAKLDDGLLDLTILYNRNVLTNIKTFSMAQKGNHPDRKQVFQTKVKSAILEPVGTRLRGEHTVNVDGELSGFSPLKITVVPLAVKVFCPEV